MFLKQKFLVLLSIIFLAACKNDVGIDGGRPDPVIPGPTPGVNCSNASSVQNCETSTGFFTIYDLSMPWTDELLSEKIPYFNGKKGARLKPFSHSVITAEGYDLQEGVYYWVEGILDEALDSFDFRFLLPLSFHEEDNDVAVFNHERTSQIFSTEQNPIAQIVEGKITNFAPEIFEIREWLGGDAKSVKIYAPDQFNSKRDPQRLSYVGLVERSPLGPQGPEPVSAYFSLQLKAPLYLFRPGFQWEHIYPRDLKIRILQSICTPGDGFCEQSVE